MVALGIVEGPLGGVFIAGITGPDQLLGTLGEHAASGIGLGMGRNSNNAV